MLQNREEKVEHGIGEGVDVEQKVDQVLGHHKALADGTHKSIDI